MARDTDYGEVAEGVSMTREVTKKNKKNKDVPGAGWYVHKESGERAIVQNDPLWGNTQAQAFTQVGFVYDRPATADEITSLPELAAENRKQEEGNLKGLSARLDKLEGVAEENKELQAELAQLRAEKTEREDADRVAAEKAAKEAEAKKTNKEGK